MCVKITWDEIEQAFAERETQGAFREAIPAMRWLAEKLKQDKHLHDLQPGVSHASLVFRGRARLSVEVSSIAEGVYRVSLISGPDLDIVETTTANANSVVEVVRSYLAKAGRDNQPHP